MRQQKNGKSSLSGEVFWRFSLAFYARPGMADALIGLQDRAGLDVNLMLFALWRGALHGQRLHASEMRAAEGTVQSRLAAIVASPESDADRRAAAEANLVLYLGAEAPSAEAVLLCRGLRDFLSRD
jgi:uncharacterized protein (TIGR02444 family)